MNGIDLLMVLGVGAGAGASATASELRARTFVKVRAAGEKAEAVPRRASDRITTGAIIRKS